MSQVLPHFDMRLLAATDLLQTSVFVIDQYGRLLWCNSAAEALIGCSRRSMKGSDIGLLLPSLRELLPRLVGDPDKYLPFNTVTELHRPLIAEPVMSHAALSALPGSGGLVLLEITEVDKVIRVVRQDQEAGMTEATKALLRNLAHEVKNPLGGIRGAAQLLKADMQQPEHRECTEVIISEADRLQSLVDRLLAPYRRERKLVEVNIHEVLERVASLMRAEFPEGLTIERDYDVSVPPIMGDREQLVQVFLNLMRNAAQATKHLIAENRAEIKLVTRVVRQVTIQRKLYRMALNVHVIDNGTGIDPSIREKIFFPLVTGRDDGTGLGLSIVQTYVEQHGGSIEVESEPGCTDFSLLFPLSKPTAAEGALQ